MKRTLSSRGVRLLLNLLAALVWSLLMTASVLLLAGHGLSGALETVQSSPLACALTALFFLLLVLGIGLVLGRLFRGMLPLTLVCLILLLVNYYKTLITGVPLELADLLLVGQVGDIAALNASSLTVTPSVVAAVLPPVVWCVAVRLAAKPLLDLGWKWSLCAAGEFALVFVLVFLARADAFVYTPLGVPLSTGISQSFVNSRCLAPLGLWRSLLFQDVGVEDYDENHSSTAMNQINALLQEREEEDDSTAQEQPNVILILSESFFDVTRLPGVTFEEDPLTEFHALQAESISGAFHTRSLGYGTCSIELEILTGLNNRFLTYGTELTNSDPADLALFPTVPGLLQQAGYSTYFLHLYNDSIYNRRELFSQLGFDAMYFSEDMAQVDPEAAQAADYWGYLDSKISGAYYGDAYLTELFIDLYEQHGDDGPLFLYGATMENHTPYTADKYDSYDYPFTTDADLSQEALDVLNAYVQGVSQSSKALKALTDYFAQVDEPTILIFYGDHRPGLGLENGDSVYNELGMYEGSIFTADADTIAELYSTDYLIWSNDPSLLRGEPGTRADSSSNYLGLELLQTAGIPLPRYWQLLDVLQEHSLIYTWSYFLTPEGEASFGLPEGTNSRPFDLMTYALYDAYRDQYLTDWLRQVP